MIQIKIKSIGVVIIIVTIFCFAQANHNLSFVQVKSKTDPQIRYKIKCAFKCQPYEPEPPIYSKCLIDCRAKYDKIFINHVYDCITHCGLIKFININIGLFSWFYNYSL